MKKMNNQNVYCDTFAFKCQPPPPPFTKKERKKKENKR